MAISQNTALFSLLGTNFGGDGRTTFGLPNLQGSVPMHWGNGQGLTPQSIGQPGGATSVTLIANQVGVHNHTWSCGSGSKGETSVVTNQVNSDEKTGTQTTYATTTDGTKLSLATIQPTAPSQPHENMQPYLGLNFIIALRGVFPARN